MKLKCTLLWFLFLFAPLVMAETHKLSDGSTIRLLRDQMRQVYELVRTTGTSEPEVLWRHPIDDAVEIAPGVRSVPSDLSGIKTIYEAQGQVSVLIPNRVEDALILRFPLKGSAAKPIHLRSLFADGNPPGEIFFKSHHELAFPKESDKPEKSVVFDDFGKITRDFRQRFLPWGPIGKRQGDEVPPTRRELEVPAKKSGDPQGKESDGLDSSGFGNEDGARPAGSTTKNKGDDSLLWHWLGAGFFVLLATGLLLKWTRSA